MNAVSLCTQKRCAGDMSEEVKLDDKREGQEWACQTPAPRPFPRQSTDDKGLQPAEGPLGT